MAEESAPQGVKVGVREGAGHPPGFFWNVDILDGVHGEAMAFLNEDQYTHLASQFRELAREEEPTRSQTIDIRPLENFYELRDKGGVLK